MYSILPPSVANELRHNRTVPARKFENVTLMFSGIVGFSKFSTSNADARGAIKIVKLLNTVYTKFDDILNKHTDVFKVTTNTGISINYLIITTNYIVRIFFTNLVYFRWVNVIHSFIIYQIYFVLIIHHVRI